MQGENQNSLLLGDEGTLKELFLMMLLQLVPDYEKHSRPVSQFLGCWTGLEQLVLILRHALTSMDLKELRVLIQISGIRLN